MSNGYKNQPHTPSSIQSGYIDIGANLTHSQFTPDLADVIHTAIENRISHMVVTGSTLETSEHAYKLTLEYPQILSSTAGVHPHHAQEWLADYPQKLNALLSLPQVKAVGETGLDFHRNFSPKDQQEKVFEAQLEMAIETQLPIFLHQREAHDRFLPILKSVRADLNKVVVHCFTDQKAALYDYLDLDCYIGMTGWICDERRGQHLIPLVKDIPNHRLLIETDAPYLKPRDLACFNSSKRNLPSFLPHIASTLAQHRQQTLEDLRHWTTQNAITFFQL